MVVVAAAAVVGTEGDAHLVPRPNPPPRHPGARCAPPAPPPAKRGMVRASRYRL